MIEFNSSLDILFIIYSVNHFLFLPDINSINVSHIIFNSCHHPEFSTPIHQSQPRINSSIPKTILYRLNSFWFPWFTKGKWWLRWKPYHHHHYYHYTDYSWYHHFITQFYLPHFEGCAFFDCLAFHFLCCNAVLPSIFHFSFKRCFRCLRVLAWLFGIFNFLWLNYSFELSLTNNTSHCDFVHFTITISMHYHLGSLPLLHI